MWYAVLCPATQPQPTEQPRVTTKQATGLLIEIDQQLETVTRALNPLHNNVPTEPELDQHTIHRLVMLKLDLKVRRASTAELVRECAQRERGFSHRERRLERERQANQAALAAAMAILQHHDSLRC